jgi:hypothetical protein
MCAIPTLYYLESTFTADQCWKARVDGGLFVTCISGRERVQGGGGTTVDMDRDDGASWRNDGPVYVRVSEIRELNVSTLSKRNCSKMPTGGLGEGDAGYRQWPDAFCCIAEKILEGDLDAVDVPRRKAPAVCFRSLEAVL